MRVFFLIENNRAVARAIYAAGSDLLHRVLIFWSKPKKVGSV